MFAHLEAHLLLQGDYLSRRWQSPPTPSHNNDSMQEDIFPIWNSVPHRILLHSGNGISLHHARNDRCHAGQTSQYRFVKFTNCKPLIHNFVVTKSKFLLHSPFCSDHASGSNQASNNFADEAVERAESSLTHLPPSSLSKDQSELEDANKKFVRFTPESLDFGNQYALSLSLSWWRSNLYVFF